MATTTMPTSIQTESPQFNAAFAYVMQVKDRFADRAEVFTQFLAEVKAIHSQPDSNSDAARAAAQARIARLFEGHADLIEGFKEVTRPVDAL